MVATLAPLNSYQRAKFESEILDSKAHLGMLLGDSAMHLFDVLQVLCGVASLLKPAVELFPLSFRRLPVENIDGLHAGLEHAGGPKEHALQVTAQC